MQLELNRRNLIVRVQKDLILADIFACVGFLLEFLYFGSRLGQVGYLLMLAAGMLCMVRHRSLAVHMCAFVGTYLLLIGFSFWQVLSGRSVAPAISLPMISTMLKCWVFLFFVYQYLSTQSYADILTFFTILSVALAGMLLVTGGLLSGEHRNDSVINPNKIGMLCGFTVSLIGYQLLSKRRASRVLLFLAAVFLVLVILLAGSRKALFLCIVPVFLYYVFQKKRNLVGRALLIAACALVGYFLIMYVEPLYNTIGFRIEGMVSWILTGETKEASMNSRLDFIDLGMGVFLENPLTGIGLATFSSLAGSYGAYSHNNYVELLVSGGIVAIVLYYLPFVMLGIRLYRTREMSNLNLFTLILLVSMLMIHMGVVVYYTRVYLYMNLCLFTLAEERKTEGGPGKT